MKKLLILLTCFLPVSSFAQVNFIENTTIKTEKASISSPASEFGPAFVEDELWYSAFINEKNKGTGKNNSRDIFYTIVASPIIETGILKDAKRIMLEEISAGYHAGPVSFSKQTNELFLTLSNYDNAETKNVVFQKKNIPLKIVVLEKSGDTWSKSGELPFNSSAYSVGHPTISVTGDTLIFASDITGSGTGKTDIYMTIRKNGKWGEMINLGNKINTPDDDMFPYFHNGKILIYATNGKQGGKGGFDLWYSVLSETGFSEPLLFPELNSSNDDFGLVVHPNEETGYFVSNRNKSNGDDDIYKVFFYGEYNLELIVKDRNTQKPVFDAEVKFNDDKSFSTNKQGVISRVLDKTADYVATTNIEGYMNESVSFTTRNQPYGTIQRELYVEKVEVGQKFVMNNIYYHFDKWDLQKESEAELDKLVKVLKDNPSWKIELGSHTDSRGTDEYNNFLSSKRSDSAVSYIAGKGISGSRIIARGYGETQLVNHCTDNSGCTEEEHRMNRRTEFKILEME